MATGSFLCPVIPGTYVVRVSRAAASHLRDLPSTQFAVRPVLLDPDFSTAQFTMTVYCPADVNRDGIYDSGDIGAFIDAFLAGDVVLADYLVDGILDLGDIGAFVDAFLLGCDGVPPPVIDDPIFQTFNEAQQELSAVPNQQIGTQTVSIGASLDLAEPFGTVTAVDLLTYMNRYLARDARANLDSNPDLDHEDIRLLRDALIEAIRLEAGGAP